MSLMDLSPLLCPDKADRYQDLMQELTGQPRRFISGKKNTFMFYYRKRGGENDSRQIALLVGGKKGHNARQMMIFSAQRQKASLW